MTESEHNMSLDTGTPQSSEQIANTDEEKAVAVFLAPKLDAMIADNARAQTEDDLPEEVKFLGKSGLLSQVSGMGQILNRCGNQLFAAIHVDGKGDRYIHFRQQYSDSTYSPEFIVSQDLLLIVAQFEQTGNPMLEQEAKKALKIITKDYLRKLNGSEFLNIPEVMSTLFEALQHIPVVSYEHEMTSMELYAEVIGVLKNMGGAVFNSLRNERRGYLALDDCTINGVAREMQLPRKQLLEQLKKHQLLYLTGSCKGYQCKIPCGKNPDGTIRYDWAYCLYDLEYINEQSGGKCPPAEITPYDDI